MHLSGLHGVPGLLPSGRVDDRSRERTLVGAATAGCPSLVAQTDIDEREEAMHPLLQQFLEKWVWPTAPGARGAPFRLRLTEEKCLKGWEIALQSSLAEIEKGLASGSDDWQQRVALGGYAAEGVQMSIKQMSA